jgi:hypothetical protein
MSTTTLKVDIRLQGKETLTEAEAPAALTEQQRILATGKRGINTTLSSLTTPKVDQSPLVQEITLAGGVPTVVDLTAVQGLCNPTGLARMLDMTGKKLVACFFHAPETNAAAINIAPGGSNPYPLFGAGNDVDLKPGEVLAKCFRAVATSFAAVAAGAKNISVSGTNGDKLYVELYFST